MPALTDFPPLRAETRQTIRARIDSDINAGVDPNDLAVLDTSEGGVYWDMTEGPVLEIERLWDFGSVEIPAAGLPNFAWGEYLDAHGVTVGLTRKDVVPATGEILMTGLPGTLVPTGTEVSTTQIDPDADPIAFLTTKSAVLAASPGPTGLIAAPSGTGGTLAANTYYYVVTAIVPNPNAGQPGQPASVETVISNEATAVTGGTSSSVALSWNAVTGATAYRIYRSLLASQETLLATPGGTATAYTDTGSAVPGSTSPPTNTIPVQAVVAGPQGNVAAGAITQLDSPVAGATAVTNPSAISGGSAIESDKLFQERVLLAYQTPQGAGNQGDYVRWSLAYPGVGHVTVEPLWAGAGTVRVIVTDADNNPVSSTIVTGLQALLDPIPGLGAGLAPIGAVVTVATPITLTVNVAGIVSYESGYSQNGASGTIALASDISAAVADYVNGLAPDDDVILEHVKARFFAVPGVHDVSGVTLNGSAANINVGPPGPIAVAQLGTVTLS